MSDFRDHWSRRQVLRLGAAGAGAAIAGSFITRTAWGETGVEGKTIGFSQSFITTDWIKQQRTGVLDSAKKYNLKVVTADANNQPSKQIRDIEDFVTQGVDIILVSTYFAEAITPAIREANRADIPIVVLSSPLVGGVKFDCHLSTDTQGTARTVGEYYVKALDGKGVVVEIDGSPGSVVNQSRGNGWHEVVDKHPDIKVVGRVVGDYNRAKAIQGMEDLLQAHGHIDAIYSHNDDMAIGALKAVREAGREKEMWATGYDGLAVDALEAVASGDLRATWRYLPFGSEAVEVAVRVLQKQPVPKEIAFPSPMITKDNIGDFFDASARTVKLPPSRLTF
ncbi:monosaccharide ABC transporter substrate-binding protein, CUT2 family [Faunimonas pinastri]|uniref:Monosaccharide ABC transporter substrate-binding protein, CUT2 family n=1 Tax=Faunimonas pinastri TaxID=1855383 RepID=A0A1H9EMZ2_9HYPH|nr:substrate-binding domain-containing protein [Faunimonas pinastri]SEQ26378.1 monosaccharide ABC transporter substrate-binding protein, CUT2 family [Faunimonas pinastri]